MINLLSPQLSSCPVDTRKASTLLIKDEMAESSALREDSPAVASSCNDAANSSRTESPAEPNCETRHANSTASSENSASVSGSEPDLTLSDEGEALLRQLARQVEYYFSTANLSKDTYVATLRSLNDGYVPISIIANFGKVRALVPYDGVNAVLKAATDYSNLIEVVMINTQTGKKVPFDEITEDTKVKILQAVGPISGEPIPVSEISALQSPSSSPSTPTSQPVQNTVILREVPNDVTEDNVRELFTFESCPPVQSVRSDVANCWFVVLDTSSRDEMLQVMFELRTKKFASGDPVKARVKSGVVVSSDAPSIPLSISNPSSSQVVDYQHMMNSTSPGSRFGNNSGVRKNKKKKNGSGSKNKNSSNKAKNTNNSNNRRNGNGKNKKGSGHDRSRQSPKQKGSPTSSSNNTTTGTRSKDDAGRSDSDRRMENSPPLLGEEQFPALSSDDLVDANTNKIEVETVPQDRPEDDLEKKSANSDGASTATTSTSSSTSKQHTLGGYAAALLKVAPKPLASSENVADSKHNGNKRNTVSKKKNDVSRGTNVSVKANDHGSSKTDSTANSTSVVVTPPSWGGGRSFADVLRKEAASATPEQ